MEVRELAVRGAFEFTPAQFHDERGTFAEGFRFDVLGPLLGHRFEVKQTNVSISRRGALRGLHFAQVPPSQAKYVTATSGVFLDVVVDVRVGSPTFGAVDVVRLDPVDRRAIYVPEGCGHLLACLEDGVAHYLCSEVFNPGVEHGLNPLDPALGLPLPDDVDWIVSAKDASAPTLAQRVADGSLPTYAACEALAAQQHREHPA